MLFRKGSHDDGGSHRSRKGFGLFGIFRLLLSLIVMCFLLLAVYAAIQSFNPTSPLKDKGLNLYALKDDPKGFFKEFISSDEVYGFITAILSFNASKNPSSTTDPLLTQTDVNNPNSQKQNPQSTSSPPLFRFAIITDTHNDQKNLKKALQQAKASEVKFVIGLGDYTDVGTIEELTKAKAEFDQAGITLYSTVGDHDLWDSRNKNLPPHQNFSQLFGSPYKSFSFQNLRAILIYNSDNYIGVDEVQLQWIKDELERAKTDQTKLILTFGSIPLFHPSSDHVMGKVNPKLKQQSDNLIKLFKDNNVSEYIAGDAHLYSKYTEPQTGLKMSTIGATTSIRNLQTPRFALVDVYQDGSYNIQDIEIK